VAGVRVVVRAGGVVVGDDGGLRGRRPGAGISSSQDVHGYRLALDRSPEMTNATSGLVAENQ